MYFPDRGAYAPYATCMATPLGEGDNNNDWCGSCWMELYLKHVGTVHTQVLVIRRGWCSNEERVAANSRKHYHRNTYYGMRAASTDETTRVNTRYGMTFVSLPLVCSCRRRVPSGWGWAYDLCVWPHWRRVWCQLLLWLELLRRRSACV